MTSPRWSFYDPVGAETYEFPVNPNSGGTPTYRKTLSFQNTAGPGGKTLIFEGRDEPRTIEVQGIVLSQAQHEAFITWFGKRRQIKLTDDLDREFWVYLISYEPNRQFKGTRAHAWRHPYSMKMQILDWA